MPVTAHRLRVSASGRLDTEDDLAAVLGVLRVMAGTTSTHWPHASWFGLYEAFAEAARQQKQDHELLRDAINTAFRELGIDGYHVASLSAAARDGTGTRGFELVIEDSEGRAHFGAVPVP